MVSVAERSAPRDLDAIFAAAPAGDRLFWAGSGRGGARLVLVGAGTAQQIGAEGSQRFTTVATAWRDVLANAVLDPRDVGTPAGPLLLGGFRFDPLRRPNAAWAAFPDALFTLPRLIFASEGDEHWLTASAVLSPGDNAEAEHARLLDLHARLLSSSAMATRPRGTLRLLPDIQPGAAPIRTGPNPRVQIAQAGSARQWQDTVARTTREIREGRFKKVVLARQTRATLPETDGRLTAFDPARTLARLRAGYPTAFHFAMSRTLEAPGEEAGEQVFVGASPERLVRLQHGTVEVASLAGSIRRGATAEEDAALGATLLDSAKEREEHAIVTAMLRDALAPLCRVLDIPREPVLMRLPNVQHLYTPIRGKLGDAHGILDLVEQLHPTPAMGGYPTGAALAAIREREGFDRGWYAAPVGWLDRWGEGEFAVAIRSALIRRTGHGGDALLFAGCGIVADSDPASEYAESQLKMQVMLSALTPES
jgi:isochorismate synthase